jgi:iron-sulfur cluster assembly protein
MVHVTAEAAAQIRRMLHETGQEGFGLRFALEDGGCSGSTYAFSFASGPGDGDLVVEEHGVLVFVPATDLPSLDGSTIGWKDSLMESGLHVDNPNVKRACGCGVSVGF